jgi:SAM-dependent methyltransferase
MDREPSTENREPFVALPTAVQWSHTILEARLRRGDIVVDATAGNGHDTVFLAERVLPGGRVFAFDVQEQAIAQTREQITKRKSQNTRFEEITLHHAGHERMGELLPAETRGCLRAVMFNLGYLPGGDKSVITRVETTLSALGQALEWLAPDGVMTVVVYPGHDGGREEADAVVRWAEALPADAFEAQRLGYVNFRATTPFCLAVRKRA